MTIIYMVQLKGSKFKMYTCSIVKHCHKFVRKIQHKGECREINTAQGKAKCTSKISKYVIL